MGNNCEAIVLRCADHRIAGPMETYLEEDNLSGKCDVVSIFGGVKGLLDPRNDIEREFLLKQIGFSVKLRGSIIKEVILSNHTDCRAYGGNGRFGSFKEECEFHIKEMRKAEEIISIRFPRLAVRKVLGKITPSGKVSFEEVRY